MTDELQHWHTGRRSFTVGQAAKLLGNLEYAATVAPWIRFTAISIRDGLLEALRKNRAQVYENKKMAVYVKESTYKGQDNMRLLKKYYAQSKVAQQIWNLKNKFFITKEMQKDLRFLEEAFQDGVSLGIPIAHLVPRDPDFTGKGDACLDGAGGYSEDLAFWWYFDWPDDIKKENNQILR